MVSDLKTVRIPCCCRLRRRVSETPLMYGNTAVDLSSAVFLSGAGFLVLVTFYKKEKAQPLATKTVDRCFFSWAFPDGLVMMRLARLCKHVTKPRFTDCGWCE